MSKHDEQYFSYLQSRSQIGRLYRNYWLYPAICRNIDKDEKVLDVGCGIGDFLRFRENTFGTDINKETVAHCLDEGLNASVMEVDTLPFTDSSFDCVVIDNVLEHILNPEPILQEIKRILVDNGKVVVGVPGVKGFAHDPDHKVFYNEDDLVLCFVGNGFSLSRLFYTPIKFNWFNEHISQYCIYGVFIK